MMRRYIFIVLLGLLALSACAEASGDTGICYEQSEWRDHDGPDSCSFYSKAESCDKILGQLRITSRLHKGAYEEGVFDGGLSSRWLEIAKDSIRYFAPDGELADRGDCKCINGRLEVKWQKGDNLPKDAEIYFNPSGMVELRYYDYPFSFNTFQYDTTVAKTNPTKIIGTIIQ